MRSFHAEKCCHLASKHEAAARRLCSSVRQFLIYSTFVLVIINSTVISCKVKSKSKGPV